MTNPIVDKIDFHGTWSEELGNMTKAADATNVNVLENLDNAMAMTNDVYVDGILNTILPEGTERDPKFPLFPDGLCSVGLAFCLDVLMQSMHILSKEKLISDFRNRYPDLVSAMFSFVLSIKSEEELVELEEVLGFCHCSFDPRMSFLTSVMHCRARSISLRAITTPIFQFLILFATINPRTLHRAGDRAERGKDDESLREIRHYMIDAPQDTLIACRQWYMHTKDPSILAFVTLCFNHHYFSFCNLASSLAAQDMLTVVAMELHALVEHIREGVASITSSVASHLHMHIHFMPIFIRHYSTTYDYPSKGLIHATARTFFDYLEGLSPSATDVWQRLQEKQIPKEYAVIAYMTVPAMPTTKAEFDAMLVEMHNTMRYIAPKFDEPKGPHVLAWTALMQSQNILDSDCFNRVCGNTSKATRFAKCSGCGVPAYCSTECQTVAWTDPQCPHKAVCKTTKKLMSCWPMDDEKLPQDLDQQHEFLKALVAPLRIPDSRLKDVAGNYVVITRAKRPLGPLGHT